MNQDPTILSQDPSTQIAAAELPAQQSPAEMIGVVDGQFDVQRNIGREDMYTEKGWNVVEVGTDTDKQTGEDRQFVLITNAPLGADGKPIHDENGDLEGDTKNIWTDKLNSWQTSEVEQDTEVVEAEHALKRVGSAAVSSEVEVQMIDTPDSTTEALTEPTVNVVQQDPTQTPEYKQQVVTSLTALDTELGRFGKMSDRAINDSVGQLIDYSKNKPVEIRRVLEGAAVGALRDANYAADYYSKGVRPALQELFGEDKAAMRRIDDTVDAVIKTVQKTAGNQDPSYAVQLKNDLASAAMDQSRAISKVISTENSQASREAEMFLKGIAASLVDSRGRGNILDGIQKTFTKS